MLFLYLLSATAALAQDTDSVIATEEDFIWLNEQLPNGFEVGDRLYRATLDGTLREDFHSRCDDQGPTVVIVQVGSTKFGGYADKSWTSTKQWVHSDEAFMFVLEGGKYDREKLELTGNYNNHALYHNPNIGPTFGVSGALSLSIGCANCGGMSRLGDSYKKAEGGTLRYLMGRKSFAPYTDFEVFSVKIASVEDTDSVIASIEDTESVIASVEDTESVIASAEDLQWLNGQLSEHGQLGGLLYRLSTDGPGKGETGFHAKCDNKGPTVVIVEATNGVKFGGYADISWTSTSAWLHTDEAFMFVLESKNYDREKLELTGNFNYNALHHSPDVGPHFGASGALSISIQCAADNCGGQSRLGDSFAKAKGGTVKYMMGRKSFKIVDWEVFSVVS